MEQNSDEVLKKLKYDLQNNITPLDDNQYTRRKLLIHNDTICFKTKNTLLPIVSEHRVDDVLKYFHNSALFSHVGITKMFYTINRKYFIPKLFARIKNHVLLCKQCNLLKTRNHSLNKPLKIVSTDHFNQLWQIDILGPFNITTKGNKYLVTMTDHFSSYPEAFAILQITADIMEKVKYKLTRENSSTVTSLKNCVKDLALTKAPRRPIATKKFEKSNDSTGQSVKNYAIRTILGTLRLTPSEKIQKSPIEMMFGRTENLKYALTDDNQHKDILKEAKASFNQYKNRIQRNHDKSAQKSKSYHYENFKPNKPFTQKQQLPYTITRH
ncbi:hypothetical protein A3Q56_08090 [Intoshia linei]|uniref:Integrase zinc-binding domain-containing protein n=1 Tax=Intoshia linei TaxID=1819745 RepID=A0A177ASI6_9BILA|nr:hypothetical protein A3Q56_08090 [Intoshia linei]